MSTTRLHVQDFKLCYLDGNTYKYFSYQSDDHEITIEPNGDHNDVCVYDASGLLMGRRIQVKPKFNELPHEMFLRTFRVASAMHNKIMHAGKCEPDLIDVLIN